jgi:uncharacterized membrane protein
MILFDILLFLHFIGIALAVGTSFAMMRLGAATKDMPMDERAKFFLRAFALSKNGSMGLGLLVLTGIGMWAIKGWPVVMQLGGGMFHAKLTLVLILAGLVGYSQVLIKKARQANGGPIMAKIPKVGMALMATGILTVLFAVLAFH